MSNHCTCRAPGAIPRPRKLLPNGALSLSFLSVTLLVLPLLPFQAPDPGQEKLARLTELLADSIKTNSRLLEAPLAAQFCSAVVTRLSTALPGTTLAFVVDGDRNALHEPVATPGYLFVPAALFREARTDAEFAAMIAHAMAHNTARHGFQPVSAGAICGDERS